MKFEIHFEFRASLRKFQNLNFWDATIPESSRFIVDQPGAPDTVWCATGQSGAPGLSWSWLYTAKSFSKFVSLFSALFLALGQTC
jgi:hypothetical protein